LGRASTADLAVRHDQRLLGVHFQIAWDGANCRLRDLSGGHGTLLGGAPVAEAEVPHRGWIRAGETDFTVHFEGHSPPPEDDEDDEDEDPGLQASRQRRRDTAEVALLSLRAEAAMEPLYGVMDASRGDRILQLLREHVEPHRSLYEGQGGEPLEDVAPYLVGPMAPDSRLLARLVLEGWGLRWGIFCTSREPFTDVRRHFRRFLLVQREATGERGYFRFYDPAVLRAVWGPCWPSEKSALVGPCGALLVEGKTGHVERLIAAR
jgi:hypothetical protein